MIWQVPLPRWASFVVGHCFLHIVVGCFQARKKGINAPFPYWDVRKLLPAWASEAKADGNGQESVEKPKSKRLDMVQWGVAFHNFALAADAVGFWPYNMALAHHKNCMQVACKLGFSSHR